MHWPCWLRDVLKGTATIKEDKRGFFQKKGQIMRAGIGKRTGCTISHAAFVMISTMCELVLMGFKVTAEPQGSTYFI